MGNTNEIYCSHRDEWRKWLSENREEAKEVWLIYYKKHTGKPRVPYNDAVEEAICFGWIDSTIQRIDEERYRQKFTPRKRNSIWSELNVRRAERMIGEGKMTPAGLALFEEWKARKNISVKKEKPSEPDPPVELLTALEKNEKALHNFNNLAPSYRRNYIGWILSSKKEETKMRRIEKAVGLLEKNVKSLM